jgi:hypothetical protein
MAEAVYLVCALTSAVCTVLLARAWLQAQVRLLFWSALCFALLTANNVLLFVDLALVTQVDLSVARAASGLAGLLVLLYALIYDRPGRRP